jgi:predicted nucleic acid-binding protein
MKVHVLDANALYRFLVGETGAELVGQLFEQANDEGQPLLMSVVNWGEVYYAIARSEGFAETDKVFDRVRLLPIKILDANETLARRAAQLKAGYGLPYADCFAAATVGQQDVLVTADTKDFKKIPGLHILPLPQHKR